MVDRPHARELIVGIGPDAAFGPVVLVGAGGEAVEVLADRSIGLPPLNATLAADMIGRTRIARLLASYRGRPAADLGAIGDVLEKLAQMATDLEALAELDINPLIADEDGVLALDSRARLIAPGEARPARPAIRPYPQGLTHPLTLESGETVTVRPVRPDDAPRLIELVDKSVREDVRLRFRAGLAALPPDWAARLSQLDYDREMALAAIDGQGAILGVARLAADPEGETAEFALMVRTDHQQRGLGHTLLSELLAYARARGLASLWGDIERTNTRMLDVAADLGFTSGPAPDRALVRATNALAKGR